MVAANLLMLALLVVLRVVRQNKAQQSQITESPILVQSPLRMTFVGDIQVSDELLMTTKDSSPTYNFLPPFRFVKAYLDRADLTFGNLNTVFAGSQDDRIYSGNTLHNTPDEFASALHRVGFDFLFTANHHALDQDIYGLNRTIQILDENGISHTGTFSSENDARSFFIWKKGINLAVLAYTESSLGERPISQTFRLNRISKNSIQEDIESARADGAEVIILHLNFAAADTIQKEPTTYQKDIIDFCISQGADIIMAEAPNQVQAVNCFETTNPYTDRGVVAYSLGNFLSGVPEQANQGGMMLTLELQKDDDSQHIHVKDINVVPVYVSPTDKGSNEEIVIFPSSVSATDKPSYKDNLLNSSTIREMRESFRFIEELFSNQEEKSCVIIDRAI